ncbi:MAG: DNA repair protein RecN [Pseudomonadota bacterium]
MLVELTVKNFALIEELRLSFGPGFNVLTGETGAGKSIIIGAVNLILGSRASSELIRLGAEEAEVQALFQPVDPQAVISRLEELGLPGDEEIIIRRVMPRNGRNRIFVNGAMATLAQLSALGRDLVALSGQHEHQQLLDPERQLLYLDQFGGLLRPREVMAGLHGDLTGKTAEASRLQRLIREAAEKADLIEFQRREIEAAALAPGEDVDLEKERSLARNAEKIYSLIERSFRTLYGDSGAVIELLDRAASDIRQAQGLDDRLSQTLVQVEDAYHQLDDAASVLRDYLGRIVFDPARLEEIEDRLALINRFKRKYGGGLAEVLEYGRQAAGRLERLAELEERLREINLEVEKYRAKAVQAALDLEGNRRSSAREMAQAMKKQLRDLGMPQLEFDVAVRSHPEQQPGPLGWDEVEFLIAPNLGEELLPLARIASGGELSRATLGLKGLLAGQDKVGVIIFDEVDTGIGGAAAEVVGRKIRELSRFHQVICITHLPQIAAFGWTHQVVFKEVVGQRTVTSLRSLSEEERPEEIARMIGGREPTDKTRAAARELISLARE